MDRPLLLVQSNLALLVFLSHPLDPIKSNKMFILNIDFNSIHSATVYLSNVSQTLLQLTLWPLGPGSPVNPIGP